MNKQEEIKLSSKWTNVGLYVGSILLILTIPVLILVTNQQEFHIGMVLSGVLFLALLVFIIYLFVFSCDARIVGDLIILKKQFRASKNYSFDKIGHTSSFQLKSTKYITVKMENEGNKTEKYLILNSNSILSFENKDAEQTLINFRNSKVNN